MDDEDMREQEGKKRGRKGKDEEKAAKKLLGKRRRGADSDEDMDGDGDDLNDLERNIRGSLGKNRKSMTPSQRKISVQKTLRDRTASRREGSNPKRLDYKPVPEEHIRLAKKINKMTHSRSI